MSGPVKYAPLSAISLFQAGGVTYDASKVVTTQVVIPVGANLNGQVTSLVNGTIRSISFDPTSVQGITGILLVNSKGQGLIA